MSDLLTVIGNWIERRVTHRGVWYKVFVGLLFVVVIGLFAHDLSNVIAGGQ